MFSPLVTEKNILVVGIEPTTLGLLDPRSNQLSYTSLAVRLAIAYVIAVLRTLIEPRTTGRLTRLITSIDVVLITTRHFALISATSISQINNNNSTLFIFVFALSERSRRYETMIDPMAGLDGGVPGAQETDEKDVIDMTSLRYNMERIDTIRSSMGIASGCIAGICGLTGLEGLGE